MIRQYKNILNKNGLSVNKYTIKGKSTIVNTNKGLFVLKKNMGNDIYNYLISRNFENFPKIIDINNDCILYEYLDNIEYDDSQKAIDIMRIIATLHRKTTYYKEINFDEYKKIYESLKEKITYINNYYLDIISNIESKVYMSPSEYLIARNISKILSCIYYCNNELENWYSLIKDNKKKRVVTLHNNLKLDNILKNKNIFLISWDKCKVDIPIYDLVNFYNRYSLNFDFSVLFDEYEKIFPLLKEEKILMNILISIPAKIIFTNNEYNQVKQIRSLLDKIYKTERLLTSKKEESADTK